MPIRRFLDKLIAEWRREDAIHMRHIAQKYADRAWMDGAVIKKTGEVVPKESA